MKVWQPGRILEVGCGSGAILYDLAQIGFHGMGVEPSEQAKSVAEKLLSNQDQMAICAALTSDVGEFDYLVSFEVLEHIEDDVGALSQWVERLKVGGRCLISVPAHPSHWNATDVMAGHFRRYSKVHILALIESCDLEASYVSTYGWPATWLIEHLRNWVTLKKIKQQDIHLSDIKQGDEVLTANSGVDRSTELRLFPFYNGLFGRFAFNIAASLQRLFYRTNLGVSYLVEAKKL